MWGAVGFLLILSSAGDAVSTELALSRPGIVESNPWMQSTEIRIGAKIAGTAFLWWLTEWLHRRNPRIAWAVRIAAVAAFSYATQSNFRLWRGPRRGLDVGVSW